ncbi:copper resistance CopC family protein [Parvularcula oceani]|uniref:copper resistance CopC family protein n=1 Tax=Parvularcula oceani TaxID=1247963 RepID=UPI0004E1432B|nr:copper resistance protein CopC [Parvularcula oceani]
MPIRPIVPALLASMILSATSSAWAHTTIIKSNIEDGSSISTPPETFDFGFSAPVILIELSVQGQKSGEAEVDFAPSTTRAESYTIPLPELANDDYTITWRAMAKDGHVMSGTIDFTVTQ